MGQTRMVQTRGESPKPAINSTHGTHQVVKWSTTCGFHAIVRPDLGNQPDPPNGPHLDICMSLVCNRVSMCWLRVGFVRLVQRQTARKTTIFYGVLSEQHALILFWWGHMSTSMLGPRPNAGPQNRDLWASVQNGPCGGFHGNRQRVQTPNTKSPRCPF